MTDWRLVWIAILLLMPGGVVLAAEHSTASNDPCYEFAPATDRSDFPPINESPVCSAILQELNNQCASAPHVCGLAPVASDSGISLPQWQPVNQTGSSRDLYQQLVKGQRRIFFDPGDERLEKFWHAHALAWDRSAAQQNLQLQVATLDVDNAGHREPVYRVQFGACDRTLAARAAVSWRQTGKVQPASGYWFGGPEFYLSEAVRFSASGSVPRERIGTGPRLAGMPVAMANEVFLFNNEIYTWRVLNTPTEFFPVTVSKPGTVRDAGQNVTVAMQNCVIQQRQHKH
jgi:hypothetical protein